MPTDSANPISYLDNPPPPAPEPLVMPEVPASEPVVVDMSNLFVPFDGNKLLTQLQKMDVNKQHLDKSVVLVRNQMLAQTDWTQAVDAPLSSEVVANFKNFRQTLRDLPEHPDFPNITLPIIPSTK